MTPTTAQTFASAVCSIVCLSGLFSSSSSDRPTVLCSLEGHSVRALYDTGASVSILSEEAFRKIPVDLRPTQVRASGPMPTLSGVDGSNLRIKGLYSISFTLLKRRVTHEFFVISNLTSPMILGSDFIKEAGLSYDAVADQLHFGSLHISSIECTSNWASGGLLTATEVHIPPQSSVMVHARAWSASPRQPLAGGLAVASIFTRDYPIAGNEALVELSPTGHATIVIDNLLDVETRLPRGAYLGSVTRTSEKEVSVVNLEQASKPAEMAPPSGPVPKVKHDMMTNILKDKISLPPHEAKLLREVLFANHDIF